MKTDWKTLALQYKEQRDNLLKFVEGAPVASGICCCGDNMEGHTHYDHAPTDPWDWSVYCWHEQFRKFDEGTK